MASYGKETPRVALVHDWLWGMRGGERCLEVLCAMFPDADVLSLFGEEGALSPEIASKRIYWSGFQRLPFLQNYYRYLLPLYPRAVRSLEKRLSVANGSGHYDLVISVSHCAAKNISVPSGIPHICYCLTPMRYIWDQYERYFSGRAYEPFVRVLLKGLRNWDVKCAAGVDEFVSISRFVASRVERLYARKSKVLYPPVSTHWISPRGENDRGVGFLSVSALVPYKNVDVVIRAFNRLGLPLTIVGRGPEEKRLRSLAGENVKFITWVGDGDLSKLYKKSKALVFAAEEDFGMTPVEMQAAGRPVIALGKGGVLETVRALPQKEPSGLFFHELNVDAICEAVTEFLKREEEFSPDACVRQARRFSVGRFIDGMSDVIAKRGIAPTVRGDSQLLVRRT